MLIEIDTDQLIELGITPNQYVNIYLLELKDIDTIKGFMDINGEDYTKKDFYNLYIKDLITNEIDENNEEELNIENLKLNKNIQQQILEKERKFLDFVNSYYELFPKGVKTGNLFVKSNKAKCGSKLKKFIQNHKEYTEEIILQATKNYIEYCKRKNYEFMKTAFYFIDKDGVSILESECENILNGGESAESRRPSTFTEI